MRQMMQVCNESHHSGFAFNRALFINCGAKGLINMCQVSAQQDNTFALNSMQTKESHQTLIL